MVVKQTLLCDSCHRVIWDEDAIEVGEFRFCVDCAPPVLAEEEENGPSISD